MTQPRILGLDIETLAAQYWVWNPYKKENLPISMMIEPARMIMWGAKWFGDKRVSQMDERNSGGPAAMFERIGELISEADMIVSYNGDNFDLAWIDGGLAQYRLPARPPVASVDLYKTVKRLRYQSSKLAYIAPLLGIGEKVKNAGWELWAGVANGDRKSWQEMRKYNVGDVELLESGYERLRPYIRNHPRLHDKIKGTPNCAACGSTRVHYKGPLRTQESLYQRFVCVDCGKWGKVLVRPGK